MGSQLANIFHYAYILHNLHHVHTLVVVLWHGAICYIWPLWGEDYSFGIYKVPTPILQCLAIFKYCGPTHPSEIHI